MCFCLVLNKGLLLKNTLNVGEHILCSNVPRKKIKHLCRAFLCHHNWLWHKHSAWKQQLLLLKACLLLMLHTDTQNNNPTAITTIASTPERFQALGEEEQMCVVTFVFHLTTHNLTCSWSTGRRQRRWKTPKLSSSPISHSLHMMVSDCHIQWLLS